MDQLKNQLMTIFAVKGDGSSNSIYALIVGLIMMNVVEFFIKHLPLAMAAMWNFTKGYMDKRLNLSSNSFIKNVIVDESSIVLSRFYVKATDTRVKEDQGNYEVVEAVLDYLSTFDDLKHLQLSDRFTPNCKTEFCINADLKCTILSIDYDIDKSLKSIEIKLYSHTLTLTEIRNWIQNVHRNYLLQLNNKLGNTRYFFNEIPYLPPRQPDGSFRLDSAPKNLTYTMTPFHTNKSMGNIFGKHVSVLKERLSLFINNKKWYEKRGLPHTLGILLHGLPGCGKTSMIKAIAKETNRHIFNLSLRESTTQRQLINLFYNESVNVALEGKTQIFSIPHDHRIYVIEDIDCLTDVVLDRKLQEENRRSRTQETREVETSSGQKDDWKNQFDDGLGFTFTSQMKPGSKSMLQEIKAACENDANSDKLNLSFMLNLIDGILETPGRILIVTTNHPDKLDPAFIRPGRIDVNLRFERATREFIAETLSHFYEKSVLAEQLPPELESAFTPAEVISVVSAHYKNMTDAINDMIQQMHKVDVSKNIDAEGNFMNVASPHLDKVFVNAELGSKKDMPIKALTIDFPRGDVPSAGAIGAMGAIGAGAGATDAGAGAGAYAGLQGFGVSPNTREPSADLPISHSQSVGVQNAAKPNACTGTMMSKLALRRNVALALAAKNGENKIQPSFSDWSITEA